MKQYVNTGHTMTTVIFVDGDGIVLKRGESKVDPREVRWIDKGVKVNEVKQTLTVNKTAGKNSKDKGE